MSDLIERVARAICGADGDHCVWPDGCGCDYRARAAIAAMREPTEAMVLAGARAEAAAHWMRDDLWDDNLCDDEKSDWLNRARCGWQAMSDAALADD